MVFSNSESDGTLQSLGANNDKTKTTKEEEAAAAAAAAAQEGEPMGEEEEEEMTEAVVEEEESSSYDDEEEEDLPPLECYQTNLILELSPSSFQDDDTKNVTEQQQQQQEQQRLRLPRYGAVDEFMAAMYHHQGESSPLHQSRSTLLETPLVHYNYNYNNNNNNNNTATTTTDTTNSEQRILYVGQREVAHALPSQTEVLVSDRATTCHVLIVRSTTIIAAGNTTTTTQSPPPPLTSCAHLDAPRYDACLQNIFYRHFQYHHNHHLQQQQQQQQLSGSDSPSPPPPQIQVDLHVAGGFLDSRRRSKDLSTWLLFRLAELANQFHPFFRCTLKTCVISTLNNHTTTTTAVVNKTNAVATKTTKTVPAPMARGLACEVATGRVFLAWCHASVMGPDPILRQARLWASDSSCMDRLIPIHTEQSPLFGIAPFVLESNDDDTGVDIPFLLSLTDDAELLKHSSTSPECEEEDYCTSVRQALRLLQQGRTRDYFGSHGHHQGNSNHHASWSPRLYRRTETTTTADESNNNTHQKNQWSLILPETTTTTQSTTICRLKNRVCGKKGTRTRRQRRHHQQQREIGNNNNHHQKGATGTTQESTITTTASSSSRRLGHQAGSE